MYDDFHKNGKIAGSYMNLLHSCGGSIVVLVVLLNNIFQEIWAKYGR